MQLEVSGEPQSTEYSSGSVIWVHIAAITSNMFAVYYVRLLWVEGVVFASGHFLHVSCQGSS